MSDNVPGFVGMVVTGLLPLVAIGAGIAALFAVRDKHAWAARIWGSVALLALGACVWVYFAILT